ncbi:Calcineurin-like phosphoesterase [Roseateles sp. YR242]|uniref:phosphodiesterase n=1 Tax=Roseateles sp. YR242 TaxID=1855305 RepID=UPI0008B61E87|nr:phosphodiesterase [Roseateles sp. YR242]SEL85871.1 Calcineurin-like phosphoesterase [Roseateles sp. YR242]
MLIGQLSDPHVRAHGVLYQGVVDSNQALIEAIDHLLRIDKRPDLVLVTGDLVDEGRPEEYAVARALLARLPMPYLVIPGNHDHRENFRAAFQDHGYLPAEGPLHYCVDDYAVRFIGLDSCVPTLHHGHIDADGLAWLDGVLESNPVKPTVVMLHHPPFVCGIPYMDEYRYIDPAPLAAVLQRYSNIELVLCGHVHRSMLRRWAGTVVCACPSTVTEIDLQLLPNALPSSHAGPRGCMLHLWDEHLGMLSHTSLVGESPGPYPFA